MNKIVTDEHVDRKPELQGLRLNGFRKRKLTELRASFQYKREGVGVRRQASPPHLDKEKDCLFREIEESVGANDGVPTKSGRIGDEVEYREGVVH